MGACFHGLLRSSSASIPDIHKAIYLTYVYTNYVDETAAVQVTQEQRDAAKALAYGLLYGKGAQALAVDLGISPAEARRATEEFMNALPGVVSWPGLLQG